MTTPDIASYSCASAVSPPGDRDTEYARIQKEIYALEAAIRALKRRHNSLSSISRLPVELLSRTFEFLACGEDNTAKSNPYCVGVSHVCSQWRQIALENPRLWRRIQCSFQPRWAIEMLKRSKMAPITVEGRTSWGASTVDEAIIAALEQLPRIEHLTLTFRLGWPRLEEISSILSGAAPLLHTFQMASEDGTEAMLRETVFSGPGGAPQLRRLSLDRCSVPWESEFLRFLTHLTVVQLPIECQLSVDDLVTNLGHMPQLESIHFSSVMIPPGDSGLNASPSPSTHLPFIARIHLEENLMSCLAFFTTFTYPNNAIVSIKCFPSDYHPANITPVRDLITVITAKNIVPITSLYLENLYFGTFRAQDSQGTRRVFIEFQGVAFQPSSISWDSLTLHHLKFLQVAGFEILRSVWLSVFGRLKELKTIHITDYAGEFLNVLFRGISRDLAVSHAAVISSPGKLKFSALTSLSLNSTVGEYYGDRPWAEMLVLCFIERRRRGLTLRRLSIEGHGDGADVVPRLCSFIKHVKWTKVYEEETSDGRDYEDYHDEYSYYQ